MSALRIFILVKNFQLEPYFNPDGQECGLDEAGRGCLAGPVVAAAVIMPKDWQADTLRDSKKLSAAQRDVLRQRIESEAIAWAVASASHLEIDKFNILRASIMAMHRAIDALDKTPDRLLVDGTHFLPYHHIPHHCFVKGDDRFVAIAAASILAKTHRDELMQELHSQHPQYGWNRNMAYPTAHHRNALEKFGPSPYHRLSFHVKKNRN